MFVFGRCSRTCTNTILLVSAAGQYEETTSLDILNSVSSYSPPHDERSAQEVATDEECLKKARSLIMMLKADVRALNTCAARLLPPPDGDTTTGTSEVARRHAQLPHSRSSLVFVDAFDLETTVLLSSSV